MAGRLKLITPPALEPVLPADLRTFGRISTDIVDATLTPLIKAAREAAEGYQNRAYITQTWELVFDDYSYLPLDIPLPPLISLVSVAITDINGVVLSPAFAITNFVVDTSGGGKGRIALKYGKYWPSVTPERAGLAIRFTCGYGAAAANVPDRIKTAIILGALFRFDNTESEMPEAFYRELDSDRIVPV